MQKSFEFSRKQAKAWLHLNSEKSPVEEIFFGGAAGAGKSVLISMFKILRRVQHPETVGLTGRKTSRTLTDTTLRTFQRVWNEYGQYNGEGVTMEIKGSPSTAYFSNGSIEMFRHVDSGTDADAHNFGSLELTDLAIDELAECDERTIKILMSRVRHNLIAGKRAIIFAGNPSDNWVMTRYVQDKEGKPVEMPANRLFIPALLSENPDKAFVAKYAESLEFLDPYDRDRLLHGIWGGRRENDKPFFQDYDYTRHMGRMKRDVDTDLWLSFDFNMDPTTVITGQKILGKGLIIDNELQVTGGTDALCREIKHRDWLNHDGFIKVTGDSSGSKSGTAAGLEPGGRHISDYTIIQKSLDLSNRDFHGIVKRNHNLTYSAKLCNYVFRKIPIFISPDCTALHRDLQTAERNDDGSLKKDRNAHKQDVGDAFRYLKIGRASCRERV